MIDWFELILYFPHKNLEFCNEDYASATASTIEDAKKLIEAGFDYVTEKNGINAL